MKIVNSAVIATLGACAVALLVTAAKSPKDARASKIARGKYLVTLGGCSDCHTPMKMGAKGPEPDTERYLAGHPQDARFPAPPKLTDGPWAVVMGGSTAFAGPWGISYAPNLTPDSNTGLGIWTEDMFVQAMRTGKHFGTGRDILPPMPWRNLAALEEADLRAVFAYLRSVTPIHNRVPLAVQVYGAGSFE